MDDSAAPFSPLMMLVGASILLAARLIYGEQRLGGGDLVHLVMRVMGYALIAMGCLGLLEILLGIVFGVLFWIVMMVVLGSMVGRYRQAERSALLWVLAISARRQMPLTPAIEAFAHEWGGAFGRRTLRLGWALRSGMQLPDALDRLRSLSPDRGRVAARVGTEAGCLGEALEEAAAVRAHQEPVWQGIVSKAYYLLIVMIVAELVTVLMSLQVAPRISRILQDFGQNPPELSQFALNAVQNVTLTEVLIVLLICQIIGIKYLMLHTLGWLPWGMPFLDRFTKAMDTGLTLRSLAWLVERGRPMHSALAIASRSYPKRWYRRRLTEAVAEMSHGAAWQLALKRHGVISSGEAQLLDSAERVGNLAWALRMVAESGERRLVNRMQGIVQAVYPLAILAISLVVGVYVIAFFWPVVLLVNNLIITL